MAAHTVTFGECRGFTGFDVGFITGTNTVNFVK